MLDKVYQKSIIGNFGILVKEHRIAAVKMIKNV
jgi:hypothetical protein